MVKPEFKIRVSELSEKINSKLSFLQSKYPEKIEKVKGTGILNGIVFKSYIKSIGDLTEKIPIRFVKNRSYFLKKITATAISCELFKRFDILTSINDSANSNHLSISPSLILKDNELNYFFDSLEKVINENLDLESIKLIFQFIKK